LASSLNRAVLWRVNLAEFGKGKDLLARLSCGSLMVSSGLRAFMPLNDLAYDVFLLFEVLVDVLLAHFVLVFA
jgi:hypothetical protein